MATYPRESDENLQKQLIKPVSLPAVKMPGARPVPVRVSLVAQCIVGIVMGCPPVPAFSPSPTSGVKDRADHFTCWGEAQQNSSYTFWGETQTASSPSYTSRGKPCNFLHLTPPGGEPRPLVHHHTPAEGKPCNLFHLTPR